MKCYKHTEEEAVAQCSRCGKFLCKECTTKYKAIICDDCVEYIQQKQEEDDQKFAALEQQNKMEDEKSWFIRATIWMAVTFLALVIIVPVAGAPFFVGILVGLVFGAFSAGYAYGWKVLEDNNFLDGFFITHLLLLQFCNNYILFISKYQQKY